MSSVVPDVPDVVRSARDRLGPVGVWLGALLGVSADVERKVARQIEALGFGSLFVGERIGGKEAMAHQAVLLAATDTCPRMLELARDRADGAHPYFVPPSHTPLARAALGPDRLLVPEQAVVVTSDPVIARRVARSHMGLYLQLPNYVNNLRHLGFSDDDVSGGGSDRLVDAIVAWGDETAIAARVRELLDSGADHVLLQPLGDVERAQTQLEALAPAVLAP